MTDAISKHVGLYIQCWCHILAYIQKACSMFRLLQKVLNLSEMKLPPESDIILIDMIPNLKHC